MWLIVFVGASIILYFLCRAKEQFFKGAALLLVVNLLSLGLINLIVYNKTPDKEYWNGYVVTAHHEEPWNEYIHMTCSRTVSCGKNCETTEFYDCSYVQYHSEKWFIETNLGTTHDISKIEYLDIIGKFGNETLTGRNRGYTISGDKFTSKSNGYTYLTVEPHSYVNKIAVSENILNDRELTSPEKEKVYDYPPDKLLLFPSVIGSENHKVFDDLNAKYGQSHKYRLWVLVFNENLHEQQRLHWKNGNKNEFCLTLEVRNNTLISVNAFTWSDSPYKTFVVNEISEHIGEKYNPVLYSEVLEKHMDKWEKKSFKDFDYISTEHLLTKTLYIAYILLCLISSTLVICYRELYDTL